METIRIRDNSSKDFALSETAISDLRSIANAPLKDLKENYPYLLVFPQSFAEWQDGLDSQCIFHLYDKAIKTEIRTGNLMGFVGHNSTELSICSRFADGKNDFFLHYLLQKVFCPHLLDLKHSYDELTIFDFLMYLFPYYFKEALSQGLFREYRRIDYNDGKVRGVVDIDKHIKLNIHFRGKIAYKTREYSYDNRITQLIRHTIEYIKTLPFGKNLLLGKETEENVRLIIDNTLSYSHQDLRKVLLENLKEIQHPYYTEYTVLQKICLQILKHEGLKYDDATESQVYGILFDGAWLWEEYIGKVLQNDFNHYTSKNSNFSLFKCDDDGKKKQKIIPDYISKDKRLVADAKYIPLNKDVSYGEERATAIYYKTLMYMLRFSSKHGLLFYPSKDDVLPKKYRIIETDSYLTEVPFVVPKERANTYNDYCFEMLKKEEEFKKVVFN
ncbi:MAG: 5-methylcytosine restriction system specificity protein McrC [Treponema sp.]